MYIIQEQVVFFYVYTASVVPDMVRVFNWIFSCASFNFQILKRNQSLILFLQHQNLQNWLGAHFLDLISILMHSEVIKIDICVLCFL